MSRSEYYVCYHGLATQLELLKQIEVIQTTMEKTLDGGEPLEHLKAWGNVFKTFKENAQAVHKHYK